MDENKNFSGVTQYDVSANKVMAALSYLIFFLPLLVCPNSQFGKFHANQSLMLLIVTIAGTIVLPLIPIIGWIALPLFELFAFILGIIGIKNALAGDVKELPLIGTYQIIK